MRLHAISGWLAATLAITLSTMALAQGPGGFGRGGGFGGPMMMMRGMGSALAPVQVDPTRSNEALLLQRNDVRSALLLSGAQQQQLDQLISQVQTNIMTQAMTAGRTAFQQTFKGGFKSMRGMSPQERQSAFQQMRTSMQQQINKITDDQDKQLESVLTPSQVARLHQLDMQWRSALALANPDMAKIFQLTPDQNTGIGKLLQQYRSQQQEQMRAIMQANMPAPQQMPQGLSPQQRRQYFQQRMQQMQQQIQQNQGAMTDAARKAAMTLLQVRQDLGKKVLALLTPAESAQWQKLLGAPFYFNPNSGYAASTAGSS